MGDISIAIDGPAGAGKGTTSRGVAKVLGYTLVDTGALYRAVAFCATAQSIPLTDKEGIEHLADQLVTDGRLQLTRGDNGMTRIVLDGQNPEEHIRTQEMGMGASTVAVLPGVRAAILRLLQEFAAQGAVVMEGRDIGTVVLPNARLKIFLTATPEERARRRLRDVQKMDPNETFERVLAEVLQRDTQDSTREIAPLRQAEDAVVVDSTGIEPAVLIQRIVALARERMAA